MIRQLLIVASDRIIIPRQKEATMLEDLEFSACQSSLNKNLCIETFCKTLSTGPLPPLFIFYPFEALSAKDNTLFHESSLANALRSGVPPPVLTFLETGWL